MSTSTSNIAINAKDNTATAFQSIQARAISAGNRIARVMGGAMAAVGAYLSFRTIKGGIEELGGLSDMAMKAGTSVDTLTKASLAFQVAGLNLPVETLAKSFQYLKKNTGEGGMENFYKVAESIAAIEDPAERGAALVKNFGRAGMELQPLIDGGTEAVDKMRTLSELMPGVSQSAADAGDEMADSMSMLGTGMHRLFLDVVGNIVGMFSEDLPGGMRAGVLSIVNWLRTMATKTKAVLGFVGTVIGSTIGLLMNGFLPAIKLVGSSITKVFSTLWESLKWVGNSIKAVVSLAVNAITDGPKAAWDAFQKTMSEANDKFKDKFFNVDDIKTQADALKDAGKIFADQISTAKDEMDETIDAANENREEYLKKLRTLNVDDLANALGKGKGTTEEVAEEAAKQAVRITNQMMYGGGNAERRLSLMGPEYRNEQRKQTNLLEKIATNTEKTAENTDGENTNLTETDL